MEAKKRKKERAKTMGAGEGWDAVRGKYLGQGDGEAFGVKTFSNEVVEGY